MRNKTASFHTPTEVNDRTPTGGAGSSLCSTENEHFPLITWSISYQEPFIQESNPV